MILSDWGVFLDIFVYTTTSCQCIFPCVCFILHVCVWQALCIPHCVSHLSMWSCVNVFGAIFMVLRAVCVYVECVFLLAFTKVVCLCEWLFLWYPCVYVFDRLWYDDRVCMYVCVCLPGAHSRVMPLLILCLWPFVLQHSACLLPQETDRPLQCDHTKDQPSLRC